MTQGLNAYTIQCAELVLFTADTLDISARICLHPSSAVAVVALVQDSDGLVTPYVTIET